MSVEALLDEIRRRGIRLWLEGDRLRYCGPQEALTADLLARLRQGKAGLLDHLRDPSAVSEYPVSFGQRALWFEYLLDPRSPAYNYAFSARIHSFPDVAALARAFQAIVDRHAILRTTYGLADGRPVQRVHAWQPVSFTSVDGSGWSEDELAVRVGESAHRPFDLETGPVFRVELYTRSAGEHLLLLNAHHIAMDFRSLMVLVEELGHLYAVECGANRPALPAVTTQYTDYSDWQARMLAGPEGESHRAFWSRRMSPEPPPLQLPADHPRPAVRTFHGAALGFGFEPELADALRKLARAEGVTLYVLLLAAFEALLHRYSGQDEFAVGSPMLGRTRTEFERTLGYFISPVVLRADLSGDITFRELLERVRADVLAAMEHQDYPFALLVQQLQPARHASRSPFFDVMFNLNSAGIGHDGGGPAPTQSGGGDLPLEAQPQAQGEGQFDLILQIFDSGRVLSGTLEYNTDLLDAATMERMASHFRVLLAGIVADRDVLVASLPLLTDAERHCLLPGNGRRLPEFDAGTPLPQLFERQVERTPEGVAVSFEGRRLTYRELNERANRLARRLRRLGVGPETFVGICVERSLEMVVGLLGILKAGGAYVPLDPAYPRDRLLHMLADSRTPVLLTQEALLGQLPEATLRVICLDRDWPDIAREDAASLPPAAGPANPAYVIYTSGSTGRPKGVVVCHEQVVRLFRATDAWFAFNERDVWTLFHSYAFDFSVWELWGALLHGGRLVVVPYLVSRSPEAFCELLGREGVTVLNQTPSAFRQLIEAESSRPLPPGSPLRCVIFGGEALDLQSLRPWYDRHDDRRPLLVNMYGITETTVHVTYRPLNRSDVLAPRGSMIGRPIPDLSLFVLDPQGRPVPAGVPGELYVGGAGLARGYLNQPGLTAERFIAHGFDGCGARLYRTGDLVRACADGDIEYLGRVDQQVKIRGFRIEIGEVETVLRNCPGVGDALVLAVAEAAGQKRLAAYVRPAPGTRPTLDELRRHASARLPDYMVPASFSFVDQFPLTPSGKIDRKALPAASTDRPELQSAFAAPVTSAERILSGIWADILGLDRVGVTDSFFTLGGDSILSVRIVAAAKASGLDFSLADVFQHQTIRELAAHARRSPESAAAGGTAAAFELLSEADRNALPPDLEDAYPLARLQAGMLFHAQLNPDSAVYCNLSSLHLRVPFNAVRLQEAIDHVVDRHPALRSWFDLSRYTEPLQLVARRLHLPLQVEDLRHLDEAGQDRFLREWIDAERTRGFDSERLPLVRFRVHRRADDRIQLTWCEHHAILDGWSVATMLTEILGEYLRRLGCEVAVDTSGPAGTFRDFIVLERDSVDSAEARDFWRGKLAGMTATRLPRWRREEGLEPRRRFGQHPVPVPADLSDRLHELARQLGVPIKSVLLAAHLKVLSAWSGRRDVLTGLISNGRPETTGSERVLGLFLNTVPLAVDLGPGTWADLVRRAHAGELEILPHRRYPLAEIQRALGTQDLVETSFNFIHFHVYQGLTGLGPVQVLDALAFERTNFTLMATFGLDPLSERSGVGLTLHYDARELAAEQVRALAESYLATLQAMTILPAGRHESTCLLPDGHRRLVLEEFNETSASRPAARCLHELFAAQADRTPDAVALVCGDETLTYDALRKRSDRLADCLRSQGVGPEVPVGVCMERTAELVVALLAVLKAGGAYVPLDAAYPPERLAFILADAGAPVVLAGVRTLDRLVGFAGRVINVGDLQRPLAPGGARGLEEADAPGPSNLAYIIYTSGSTGRPKGVAIEHRSVFEFIQWARGVYSDAELAGVLASTSVCFDLSIFELFVPLSWGGRVILVANALALPEVEPAARVTLVNTVPSAMAELMRLGGLPRSVRTVNLAGEPLSAKLVDQVYRGTAVQRVFDLYGPSEDTTYSTAALRSAGQPATIGGPISNTRIYILDANLQPVPMGAVGELYISGAGLARGYWRRPDLTAERFIPDPFSRSPGARMYCTGDLGRHRRDGCIEFLGRSDHQVKIRGFRIELGEIEATLAGCPGVASAVLMVAGGEADQRLVAYFVRQDGHAVEAGELRAYLAARLPAYMIPVGFVELEAMPQTPNGKIDRRRLPAWTGGALRSETVTTVPRDDVEERVAQCWRELLGVDDIGVDTDFFTLGGHSLLATQAVARLREQFGVSLPLRSLFDAPTVAGVAEVIRQARSIQAMSASPAGDGGDREEIEL